MERVERKQKKKLIERTLIDAIRENDTVFRKSFFNID